MIRQLARVAILGHSIVEGLARYPAVWNDHLKLFNTVNCGDSIQHLLWRVGHLSIPHVIVTGILPRDLQGGNRSSKTNSILKKICWTNSFSFIEPSTEWVSATGELNKVLYYTFHSFYININYERCGE